jgi:hypothetical protein
MSMSNRFPFFPRSPSATVVGLLIVLVALIAFATLGWRFVPRVLESRNANQIYPIGQRVAFPLFDVTATAGSMSALELPLRHEQVARYGGLDTFEDCTDGAVITEESVTGRIQEDSRRISEQGRCRDRNNARASIKAYQKNYDRQIRFEYVIQARHHVDLERVSIDVVSESGRNLWHAGLENAGALATWHPGTERSELGGRLNAGLQRSGFIRSDLKPGERVVDLVVTDRTQADIERVRIFRVTQ